MHERLHRKADFATANSAARGPSEPPLGLGIPYAETRTYSGTLTASLDEVARAIAETLRSDDVL
jgi:hypothetical protein